MKTADSAGSIAAAGAGPAGTETPPGQETLSGAESSSGPSSEAEAPDAGVIIGTAEAAEEMPESEPEKIAGEETLTLLFAGDIYLSSHVLNAYDKAGGVSGILDEKLRNTIDGADIFMANEEFPFSDRGTAASDKEYTFRLLPDRVSVMKAIGPDIVVLANNHAMDYGPEALLDTCRTLNEAGILHVGAGADLEEAKALTVMEVKDKKIGFLAASRVIPDYSWAAGTSSPGMLTTYDPALLLKEIEKAKETCDYLVVYVHWGIEKIENPEEYQRTLGQQYIDAGADIVVGSHPHVLQGIEYYKGKPIIYSLGNFVFGSSIPKTALLEVEITPGTGEQSLRLIPAASAAGYTKTLDEGKWPEFFNYMEGLSFGVAIDDTGHVSSEEKLSP